MVFTDAEIRKNGLKCLENERGNFAAVTLLAEMIIFPDFPVEWIKKELEKRPKTFVAGPVRNHAGPDRLTGGSLRRQIWCSETG
jgi:hypothetical protein